MAFALNIEPPKHDPFPIEAEAREWTWREWRRRHRDRLFPLPDLQYEGEETLERWNAAYRWLAVGVVAPMADRPDDMWMHQPCAAGVWLPATMESWLGGPEIRLQSLGSGASTLHRSPQLVSFIVVLPDLYQRYAQRFEDEDNQRDQCGNCTYTFREGEERCRHCWRCANCCYGQGRYPQPCVDAEAAIFSG
jgi:hypothetical protein